MGNRLDNCPASRDPSDVPLNSLETDAVDFGFLTATRFFCLAFSRNDHSAWVNAMIFASDFFPGCHSAESMRLALAVVHEMRMSRCSTFHFSNPRCLCCSSFVTQDERYLLQLVQHIRAGRRSKAASSAMLLCEGHSINGVMAASERFADFVNQSQTSQVFV